MMSNREPRLSQRGAYLARNRANRPSSEARLPSAESGAPMIGCVGCLAVIGIAVVDVLPALGVQGALASGQHAPWAEALIAILGLGAGPVMAALVGYVSFRSRNRLVAALEARRRGLTELDNAAAFNLSEWTFVVALAIALGAGAAVGSAVVAALNVLLP